MWHSLQATDRATLAFEPYGADGFDEQHIVQLVAQQRRTCFPSWYNVMSCVYEYKESEMKVCLYHCTTLSDRNQS